VYTIASKTSGERFVKAIDFYLEDGGMDLNTGEILVSITLPFSRQWEYLVDFKQAQRICHC
jgi:CO/xanthine dehydrogenase FAD-binding subunit